jgi:C1A family cysteine protease
MDLSPEEFAAQYLLKDKQMEDLTNAVVDDSPIPAPEAFPPSFDWNSKNVITPVYNQGQCGSCWAFSTTEGIESMWALAGNTLTRLSMQQIVDCDRYDSGCNGGEPMTAYKYVMLAGGLEAYTSYPYVGVGGPCRFDKTKIVATIKSWQWVTRTENENQMQSFVNSTGPPSICVDASTWQYYKSGVITRSDGCGTQIDHCVQLTGWQQMKGMTVWNVRNSWGLDWGMKGYLYVEKGYDVCGIAQECTSSIIN